MRPFHRVNGPDTYPTEGVVPHPVKLSDEVTLDFAVRGDLLNVWVNGKLTSVYRLPVAAEGRHVHDLDARRDGRVLRGHAGRAAGLGAARREARARTAPSPLGGPVVLTKADAEKLREAGRGRGGCWRSARVETARAAVAAVEARVAADTARFAEPPDEATAKTLALAAGKAERQVAALKAAEAVLIADRRQARRREEGPRRRGRGRREGRPDVHAAREGGPGGSTGRRLALAKWIADRENPLTARVAVNHIWMRHFGTPLVPTVANFGLSGKKPTHPELLDWLAVEFVESEWSMKHLHRLIVTSRAYRLSSRNADGPSKTADPDNRLYWRANPRRMDAEVVRDSLLAVAGQLDATLGGPILDEKLGLTSKRRSLYFRFNAEYKMSFLDQFDAASPTECYERRESVIPQQALALHNSALALNVSRELAKQLAKANDAAAFVTAAFERVLGRAADRRRAEAVRGVPARPGGAVREAGEADAVPRRARPVTPPSTDPAQRAREDLSTCCSTTTTS